MYTYNLVYSDLMDKIQHLFEFDFYGAFLVYSASLWISLEILFAFIECLNHLDALGSHNALVLSNKGY